MSQDCVWCDITGITHGELRDVQQVSGYQMWAGDVNAGDGLIFSYRTFTNEEDFAHEHGRLIQIVGKVSGRSGCTIKTSYFPAKAVRRAFELTSKTPGSAQAATAR